MLSPWAGFIAKAMRHESAPAALKSLLQCHHSYLRLCFLMAGGFGLCGSACFVAMHLRGDTRYSGHVLFFMPVVSSIVKRCIRKVGIPAPVGLAIAGGLTNIWNVLFFAVATASLPRGPIAHAPDPTVL